VVEKAQHEPHWPWFLIGVMTPFPLQSTEEGEDTDTLEATLPVTLPL